MHKIHELHVQPLLDWDAEHKHAAGSGDMSAIVGLLVGMAIGIPLWLLILWWVGW